MMMEHLRKSHAEDLNSRLAMDIDGSFEELVRALQNRVYAVALRLSGSAQDAEEITQDTFVKAYRALCGYPVQRVRDLALRSWLYQIELNIFRNRLRRRRLRLVQLDKDGEALSTKVAAADGERPERLFERAEEWDELSALVAKLPQRYRAAVVLRHVEGLPYAELAVILGQPVGTVKANVHRGVQLLRTALLKNARLD